MPNDTRDLEVEIETTWAASLRFPIPHAVALAIAEAGGPAEDVPIPPDIIVNRKSLKSVLVTLYGKILARGSAIRAYEQDGAEWILPSHSVRAIIVRDAATTPARPDAQRIGFRLDA